MPILSSDTVVCDLSSILTKFGMRYDSSKEEVTPLKESDGYIPGASVKVLLHKFVFPDTEHGIVLSDVKGNKSWSGFIGETKYGAGWGEKDLIDHLKRRMKRYKQEIGK